MHNVVQQILMKNLSMDTPNHASNDGLTALLSRLPIELRLYIYKLSLNCIRHRKHKILLDYIVDSRWMSTSPALFSEAAPLVLSERVLFVHTKLDVFSTDESLAGYFDKVIERTFPDDYSWVLEHARPMVERLAVTICYSHFYTNSINISERLEYYFSNLIAFTGLKVLYISLAPEYLPWSDSDYVVMQSIFDRREIREALYDSPFIRKLGRAVRSLKAKVPRSREVRWRFDKASMPCPSSSYPIQDRGGLMKFLTNINECMESLWTFVGSQSDESLDKVLAQ